MRGLQLQQETTGTLHRPKNNKQRTREHTDTMQALSLLLAYFGKAYWSNGSWENATTRVANGVSDSMDRLKAIGNGQVPLCAATAWRMLIARLECRQ